jgi:hypothetical protein
VDSEWSEEVLFPSANAIGYRLIFEAETWLRRICWAALLLSEGPAWAASLDDQLRKRLEKQSKINSSRWYLGVDAEEELLWSTTHGQLAALLRIDSIQHYVRRLCGMAGEILALRLESIAQVRHTLAHNRAISEDTLTVLGGDLIVIRNAAKQFKSRTLYALSDVMGGYPDQRLDKVPDDLLEFFSAFEDLSQEAWKSGQQVFVDANPDFVNLVRLPVEPFDVWPDGIKLRKHFGLLSHLILCVLANKTGAEMQVVLPRNLPFEDKMEVLEAFLTRKVLQDAWTTKPPEEQDPAGSCWPRLWFYENRIPEY